MKSIISFIGTFLALKFVQVANKDLKATIIGSLVAMLSFILTCYWYNNIYWVKSTQFKHTNSELIMDSVVAYYGYPPDTFEDKLINCILVMLILNLILNVIVYILISTIFSKYCIPKKFQTYETLVDFYDKRIIHGKTKKKK